MHFPSVHFGPSAQLLTVVFAFKPGGSRNAFIPFRGRADIFLPAFNDIRQVFIGDGVTLQRNFTALHGFILLQAIKSPLLRHPELLVKSVTLEKHAHQIVCILLCEIPAGNGSDGYFFCIRKLNCCIGMDVYEPFNAGPVTCEAIRNLQLREQDGVFSAAFRCLKQLLLLFCENRCGVLVFPEAGEQSESKHTRQHKRNCFSHELYLFSSECASSIADSERKVVTERLPNYDCFKSTRAVVPAPTSLFISRVPPCAATISFTSARPRPMPPVFLLRDRSTM